jgi:hypothetical protein
MHLQISLLFILATTALADVYTLSSTIPWSPKVPASVDQSVIYNSTYYLADRSNQGIHVISLTSSTQTTLITGFLTTTVNGTIVSSTSGPDGIIILPNRNELYVGDGDGTVKVIDLFTNKIVANITTGSKKRADEFAYDPTSGTIVVTNPNESPDPYVTVINATTRTVLGKVTFKGASGLEQPRFNPSTKKFYISVPDLPSAPSGAVATLDLTPGKYALGTIIPTPSCSNAGIVFGAPTTLFVSCSAAQQTSYGIATSYIYTLDASSGTVATLAHNVSGVNGVDQVAYSATTGWFYASAYQHADKGVSSPFVAVVAPNGTVVQRVVTDNSTAHAVAVDEATGSFVVPVKAKGVLVYALGGGATGTSTGAAPSGTASGAKRGRVADLLVLGGVLLAGFVFSWNMG